MATFYYECAARQKSEETCIFAWILAWSCSNLVWGEGGGFLDSKSKINKKILFDVILTSKWREGKIPMYHLQKMHMASLWHHFLSNCFESVNLFSSYDGLSAHQIWFDLSQRQQSYGGGRNPPSPGWECIKSPRWDRVNTKQHQVKI